ncbi:MAG: Fur family transcriptional regulator [Chloroflexota bacterium]|nr:Fur family transcriptional regulator [Chloroflexota bacterium]
MTMFTVDRLCTQLREQGRRVTPQRRAIIRVLLEGDGGHLTAEQIFKRVQYSMPDMSHATVYNTLRELTEMDVLLELNLGLGERRYDLNTTDHAHLVCLTCGRIEDVPYDCAALKLPPEQTHGFRVVGRRVIFRGYCPACTPPGSALKV